MRISVGVHIGHIAVAKFYISPVKKTFKKSLFEINHSLIFCSSLFTFEKKDSYVLVFKKLVCIDCEHCSISKLEELGKTISYVKFNSGPRIDPCCNPHVIFCSFVLLSLLMQMYCFLFVNSISKTGKICTYNSIDLKLFQRYYIINFIKRLWKVNKNSNGVVLIFNDSRIWSMYQLNNCMFSRVAFWKPNCGGYNIFLPVKYLYRWLCITRSKIFEKHGRTEIGR